MLNCPACGHAVPEYGQSETWRDAAKRWRDYAKRLEELLQTIEDKQPSGLRWKNVADERGYLLAVAEAKLAGTPVPPQPSDKGIIERDPQVAHAITGKTLSGTETDGKETTTDQPN
jgi:hypothetical protein